MNNKLITKEGNVLEIMYDEDCESPREWDNLSTIICFHKKYNLGDKTDYSADDYDNWFDMHEQIMNDQEIYCIKELYLYDHGNITISTTPFSCKFDSGQVGFVYVTVKDILNLPEEYPLSQIEEMIISEVKTYNDYLQSNTFAYVIKDLNDNIIESSYGFIGRESLVYYLRDLLTEESNEIVDKEFYYLF